MAGEREWLTWPEAAALVGCPVPTIDWHTRTGRIERRERAGSRPSLRRSSVEEFATWWQAREQARRERRDARERQEQARARHRARAAELGIRPGRLPAATPGTGEWLTAAEAAALLGVSAATVTRLARVGGVRAERVGSRWWFAEDDTRRVAAERQVWLSFRQAAELVGCSEKAIATAVADGLVNQRRVHRTLPSVERASVEKFAETWRRRQERRAERRERREQPGPPQDGHVWLDSQTAALVLGVGRTRVSQLAARGSLPHRRHGGRLWFRRDLLEQVAAARAFARRADRSPSWPVAERTTSAR